MAFKPFEKAPAKGKIPVKPGASVKAVAGPKGAAAKVSKPMPFAKGGAVKKGSRGC